MYKHNPSSFTVDLIGKKIQLRLSTFVVLVLLFYGLTHSIMLADYPYLSMDEPWVSGPTYHYIQTGEFKNPAHTRLSFSDRNEKVIDPFFVQQYSLYPAYRLLGTGVVQGRIWMAFWGLMTLLFTYKLAKYLFNRNVAAISILLLAIDSLFIYKTRVIRAEPLGTLLAVSSIYYFVLAYESRKNFYAVVSGLLCGLAIFNHPMGGFVALAIIVLTVRNDGWSFFKSPYLWLAGLFALTVFSGYFVNNDLNDLLRYKNVLDDFNRVTFRDGNPFVLGLERELDSLKGVYYPLRIVSGLVVLAVIGISIFVKKKSVNTILLVMSAFLVWSFIFPPSHIMYYVYITPYIAILIAASVFYKDSDLPGIIKGCKIKRGLIITGIILYIGNHLAYTGSVFYRNRNYDYLSIEKSLDKIPEEYNRVLGDYIFWFMLKDRDYVSMANFASREFTYLELFKPQVIIIGNNSLSWYPPEKRDNAMRRLDDYIKAKGGYVFDTISTPYYGPIRVFVLDDKTRSKQ